MLRFVQIIAASVLALTAAFAHPATAHADSVLHRGNQNEPDTLDPNKATGSWENNILGDLFLGLMTEDAAGDPIAGAAESWSISPDGLTWTFTLRDHQWSDGVPVTAEDFVFGMRRALSPALASEYASILYPIKGAFEVNSGKAAPETLDVRAIDARTLSITLTNPAPYLPQLLMHQTAFPIPKHLVEAYGANWTQPGILASNGPYMLSEWVPNGHVKLVKNPHFYDAGSVAIDTVIFYPTDDSEAALRRFRAGELDTNTGIPSQKLDFVRSEMAASARIALVLNVRYIAFNTSRKPFDDVRVRAALSMAIDREAIVEKILKAGEKPAYALVPPGTAGYSSSPSLSFRGETMAARQAEARRLLSEAGYGADHPLSFPYNYIGDPDSRRMAVALTDFWSQVGVRAEAVVSEKKVHYDLLRNGNYEVGEANWFADYNDAKNFLFLVQPSSGPMNISKYASMDFEALMGKSDAEADGARRQSIMAEAEQLMLNEHPIAPLFFGVSRTLVSPRIEGWVDNLTNVHRTRFMRIKPAG
ncbi:MAG: peptide ABC transporter substrate-binding protein [Alphaproteobacteria bacterium]|nr:peptide ABC transporter substrate-binding protein [Alphaproteobacteria bacterium]